ncbi:MAG: UDP-3-O-acyl-N-acetylglucosamine deacetylase [Pseudomonadota bacterium]
MIKQRTLRNPIHATGIGVHSGKKVFINLMPAPVDAGIVFRRVDLTPSVDIPARADLVSDTMLSTTLEKDGVKVSTVEHLMSALAGLGVDNAVIEIDGPEVPIMDGSAGPFVFLIQSTGIQEQAAAKRFIKIIQPISVSDGDKKATLLPFDGFKIGFTVEFDHPVFRQQNCYAEIDFSTDSYIKEISRARTFGFVHEVEYLRSKGLALGGSMDNAVVIDEFKVLNEGGLRYEDEMVRHKVLDALGDVYLQGSFIGELQAYKSGHGLNNQLMRAVIAQPDCWEEVTFETEAIKGLSPIPDFSVGYST